MILLLLENQTVQIKKSKIIQNQISSKFIILLVLLKIHSKRKEEKDMLLKVNKMILRKIMNLSHRSPHIVYFIRKTKLKNQKMTQSLLEHLVEMEFWLTIMTIEQQIQTRRIRTTTKVHRTSVIAHQLQIPMAQACSALIRATWDRFKRITVANLIIRMIFQA